MTLGDFREITKGYPDDCPINLATEALYSNLSGIEIRETAVINRPALILHS